MNNTINNRIMRYLLIKKEKEMGVTLDASQQAFYDEMELAYNILYFWNFFLTYSF